MLDLMKSSPSGRPAQAKTKPKTSGQWPSRRHRKHFSGTCGARGGEETQGPGLCFAGKHDDIQGRTGTLSAFWPKLSANTNNQIPGTTRLWRHSSKGEAWPQRCRSRWQPAPDPLRICKRDTQHTAALQGSQQRSQHRGKFLMAHSRQGLWNVYINTYMLDSHSFGLSWKPVQTAEKHLAANLGQHLIW